MSKLEGTFFRNKVFSNNYTLLELTAMKTGYLKEATANPARVVIIDEYLEQAQAAKSKSPQVPILDESEETLVSPEMEFEGKIASRWMNKRKNARDRGIDFELTLNDIRRLMQAKKCFYTGLKFSDDETSDLYLTFDRKDPTKGYTKENTVSCTHFANQFKNIYIERASSVMCDNVKMLQKMSNKIAEVYPTKRK